MKNGEKYKSVEERTKAYRATLRSRTSEYIGCEPAFRWLDAEAECEKPLPCPFCGGKAIAQTDSIGNCYVTCFNCTYKSSFLYRNLDSAIAAHNRLARAAKEINDGR